MEWNAKINELKLNLSYTINLKKPREKIIGNILGKLIDSILIITRDNNVIRIPNGRIVRFLEAKYIEKDTNTINEAIISYFSKLPGVWRKFDQTKLNDGDIYRFKMERINKIEEVTGVYYEGKVYFYFNTRHIYAVARGTIKQFTILRKEEKENYLEKLTIALNEGLRNIINNSRNANKKTEKNLKTIKDLLKRKKTGLGFKL